MEGRVVVEVMGKDRDLAVCSDGTVWKLGAPGDAKPFPMKWIQFAAAIPPAAPKTKKPKE